MDKFFASDEPIVWQPTPAYIERSHLKRFMTLHKFDSPQQLWEKSVQDISWFTDAVLKYLDIQFQQPYSTVVDLADGIQWPRWCVDGKLNIVFNCVDKWAANPDTRDRIAVQFEGEEGQTQSLTYGELSAAVNQCANGLRQLGLGKGDAVGLFMPMMPEIVIALLAIARIGGIIVPLFSGFGAGAVASRLADVEAKAIFTADGMYRRGKPVLLKPVVDEAAAHIPTLQHAIVFRRANVPIEMQSGRDHWWDEVVLTQATASSLEPTDAEDVLMIIYTSGTTGKPKGAVHTHCGFPIKSAQDMAFGMDVHAGDVIYWVSDMGWMMGPWLVFGSLLLGATCFLYDGAPDYPNPDRLWGLVERHRITALGISPTLIRALMVHGESPVRAHDLSSLQVFGSTGEPWNPDPWLWLFDTVGQRQRPIINYSGGTEIGGGILMCHPLAPQKPMAFSAVCFGIAADVVDEHGQPVRGQVGELVIRAPWIGMTRGFWRDRERYLATYWSTFPDIWVHGDWAAVDADGMWYILGRSDDTIKIAGKRIGPAEVESILVNHEAVSEAAAIGVPHEIKGSELVCFCVLVPGTRSDAALRQALREKVAAEMGKPMQPQEVLFVADLPKTRNGKIMRRIIRAAYLGLSPGDTSSLTNPDMVEAIRALGANVQS
ncbi:MAG: AMP-binding protein [Anaerolineae bacterium]|nr:AMP-binding protein [Anaerolineae bacterium]